MKQIKKYKTKTLDVEGKELAVLQKDKTWEIYLQGNKIDRVLSVDVHIDVHTGATVKITVIP